MADTGNRRTARRVVVAALTALALMASAASVASVAPPAAAQAAPVVAGTVRDAGTGTPVPDAQIVALRSADLTLAAGTVARPDGTFVLGGLGAGTYFLYLIDPAGAHTAGFHGPPTLVTVGASGTIAVDPTMVASRGRVAGRITEDGSAAPVAGAWVAAVSASTGGLAAVAVADASGAYAVEGLLPGPYLIISVDPTATHLAEFHDDSSSPGGASTVAVSAATTTTIDTALAPTVAPPATSAISGSVTAEDTTAPIPHAWVVALDAASLRLAGGARTGIDGSYTLPLAPGRYLIEVVDPSGDHAGEWYDDQPLTGLGTATPVVVDGPAQVDVALPPTRGSVSGTVVEDLSGDPVPNAWALAIGTSGVRSTTTAADGTFRVAGLSPGTYRVAFVDPSGGRGVEYWDGSGDYASALPVTVASGTDTPLVGSLPPPRCGNPQAPAVCLPAYPVPAPGAGWSRYNIATGAHSATVTRGAQSTAPLAGFTSVAGRRFHFLFDSTARYVLTNPTQPEDQFDWNKLPGLSDCGDIDLSRNGWMFGWRWRTDLTPRVLEITAYANNNGVHLTPPTPLVTLTRAQVDAKVPLWFELAISADRQRYEFRAAGPGSRSATATLPRQCPATSVTGLKWAAGFYFGGTSTAPTPITGWINEP